MPTKDSRLDDYRQWRKELTAMHAAVFETCAAKKGVLAAARELGLLKKGAIVTERCEDSDALQDFVTYEARPGKRSYVEQYAEEVGGKNPREEELLRAMLQADTSLWGVLDIDRQHRQLVLADMLVPERRLKLTDVGMSETGLPDMMFFGRLLRCGGFTFSTGVTFPFSGEHADFLVRQLRKFDKVRLPGLRKRKVYALMHDLCKKIGMNYTFT